MGHLPVRRGTHLSHSHSSSYCRLPAHYPPWQTSKRCYSSISQFSASSLIAHPPLHTQDPAASRRNWDTAAYTAKAKEQDAATVERAKAADAALKQGKKPPRPQRARDDALPKPTRKLEARTEDLGIEKNLNKTMLVTAVGGKTAKPGFFVRVRGRDYRGGD